MFDMIIMDDIMEIVLQTFEHLLASPLFYACYIMQRRWCSPSSSATCWASPPPAPTPSSTAFSTITSSRQEPTQRYPAIWKSQKNTKSDKKYKSQKSFFWKLFEIILHITMIFVWYYRRFTSCVVLSCPAPLQRGARGTIQITRCATFLQLSVSFSFIYKLIIFYMLLCLILLILWNHMFLEQILAFFSLNPSKLKFLLILWLIFFVDCGCG